jgi:predicted metallopeptidase
MGLPRDPPGELNILKDQPIAQKLLPLHECLRYIPGMDYSPAPEIDHEILRIIEILGLDHIPPERVRAIRSRGSRSRRIIARCHGLPKALQTGLTLPAHYVIEVVSEKFDRLPEEERIKTLIHELLHIPRVFGGGFRNHDYVRQKRVNMLYERYRQKSGGGHAETHRFAESGQEMEGPGL